jgi:hypothetical protein
VSPGRPARAPYWPDRSAHRRRRLARRTFWVAVALVVVLPWSGYRLVRQWIGQGMQDAPAAVDVAQATTARTVVAHAPGPESSPVATAPAAGPAAGGEAPVHDVEAIGRDARAGDGEAAVARLEGLDAQVHREALLADRGSAVRREAARRELAGMSHVRAAGWVDRMTLLLVATGRGHGQSMIAEACRRLAGHGDVSGLAVRVQEIAAGGIGAGAMIGECNPRQAMAWTGGAPPGTPVWTQAEGNPGESPDAAAERRRRQEESLRILSESTPELPSAPGPRVDP